jgi:hypothetical protein
MDMCFILKNMGMEEDVTMVFVLRDGLEGNCSHIIDGNTNGLYPLVYFRGKGNCSQPISVSDVN